MLAPAGPRAVAGGGRGAGSSTAVSLGWDEIRDRSGPSVVSVEGVDCRGPIAGSGFLFEGMVVTSAHVVSGSTDAVVQGVRGRHPVAVTRVGEGIDLAMLPLGLADGLALAPADAPVGAEVLALGRVGGALVTAEGVVHLYVDAGFYGGSGPALLVDLDSGPGYSGGPLLDRHGRVVGVLRAVDTTTGLAVAEPVSVAAAWINTAAHVQDQPTCKR